MAPAASLNGRDAMTDSPPFHRVGPTAPASPVILSVPHAGRAYSPALLRAARVPMSVLETLEDRLVDRLVWRAVAAGAGAVVADAPRAEIDLNRDEREIDPAMVVPAPRAEGLMPTLRMRGGLGLVPARVAGAGALWRGRIGADEMRRRIASVHRPYHAALGEALIAARAVFGVAVLLDCHSMPPRTPPGQPGIVFGDRHGATIAPALLEAAMAAAAAFGCGVARNEPYAGGHIVERHARPAGNVHALQIEIDRALYLDAALREPGPGFDRMAQMLAAVAAAVASAAVGEPTAVAAE